MKNDSGRECEDGDVAQMSNKLGERSEKGDESFSIWHPDAGLGRVILFIWIRFAVKRRQTFMAGFLIGALAGILGAIKNGGGLWHVTGGAVLGFLAVGLIVFLEQMQAHLNAARLRREKAIWKKVLFVIGSLLALLTVALALAGVVYLCTQ